MKIKGFEFPTFENWNKTRKFAGSVGDYTCRIDTFSWYADGSGATYQIGISADANPLNIYSNTLFKHSITVKSDEIDKLHEWYDRVTVEANNKWNEYIKEVYLMED